MLPIKQPKRAHGLVKLHKDPQGTKFRPIVSGFNTCTSGVEKYLKSTLKSLINDCQYSVNGIKHFKQDFQKHREKFDKEKHIFVSFDAVSLYTNVNVETTVDYIVDRLYENPEILRQYEKKTINSEPIELPPIPKDKLKKIFLEVLLNINTFHAGEKIFQQKEGLVMGNSISPILANLFCHMMESKVIKPKHGKEVIYYCRFVDDVFAIVKKESLTKILSEMNAFDDNLKFTLEMPNPNIAFLDTEIYLDNNNKLQHKHYKKPTASTVLTNYKTAVSPYKYQNSTLCGEIYRQNNTCSNESDLEEALANLTEQFLRNGYPLEMIRNRISEIKARNFQSKPKRVDLKKVDWADKFTLVLPYTSMRCSDVERKLTRAIKAVTPNYHVNFSWSLIKLGKVVTPRLKPALKAGSAMDTYYLFTVNVKKPM